MDLKGDFLMVFLVLVNLKKSKVIDKRLEITIKMVEKLKIIDRDVSYIYSKIIKEACTKGIQAFNYFIFFQ